MRAVLYCRVSSLEQTKNLSLPTQEKACREYCARQGYEVDRLFVDAESARSATDRPEFVKLLSYCREQRGRVNAVVVYAVNRFARNNTDHHGVAALLRGLGVSLRSVTEPIDDTPSGKLMEAILAGFAQFDNDVRSERVTAGMNAARERGRWVNRPPIGYLIGRGMPSLVPDPDRAPLVREAFALAAAGVRGRLLIDRLTALGLRTRSGNELTATTLYPMLRNRAYLGLLHAPTAAGEVRGDFEPLVDEETFGRVQAQLTNAPTSTKAIARQRNHPDFPLRRFARCGVCGRPLTGSKSKGSTKYYAFYHCRAGCVRVPAGVLETAFLGHADQLRPDPDYWRLFRDSVIQKWQGALRTSEATRQALDRRISILRTHGHRLDEAFVFERSIDRESYEAQRDRLREQLALARQELAEVSGQERTVESDLDFAYETLAKAGNFWRNAPTVKQRQLVQWMLFPDGIVVNARSTRGERRAVVEPRISAVTCWRMFDLPDVSIGEGKNGAGNGIRTRDFDLGKVALYH